MGKRNKIGWGCVWGNMGWGRTWGSLRYRQLLARFGEVGRAVRYHPHSRLAPPPQHTHRKIKLMM